MNYKFFILLFLIVITNIFSQERILNIEYDFYFKDYFPESMKISLISNGNQSLSTLTRTIYNIKLDSFEAELTSFYKHYYKTQDSILSEEELDDKKYFIKEPLDQFKWKLTGNTKTILNYVCQEATVSFRGRNYFAYFTSKIPFRVAPWKFHGLPGAMLAIATDDENIKIEAQSIKFERFSGTIGNPYFKVENTITWQIFVDLAIKNWQDFKNRVTSQAQSLSNSQRLSMGMPKISPSLRMEIIIEQNGNN